MLPSEVKADLDASFILQAHTPLSIDRNCKWSKNTSTHLPPRQSTSQLRR